MKKSYDLDILTDILMSLQIVTALSFSWIFPALFFSDNFFFQWIKYFFATHIFYKQ